MLDNDEPWKPPELQKHSQAPKLVPQVPELTIISTETPKSGISKTHFLQRPVLTENIKTFKPQVATNNPMSNKLQPMVTEKKNFGGPLSHTNERQFMPILNKPQVPDITILDDDAKNNNYEAKKSTEKVFTNSYKEMLINSHDQFLKQFQRDQSPTTSTAPPQIPLSRYKQNPLAKYIPSVETKKVPYIKDGNSSSILSDVDVTQNKNKINSNSKDEGDEVTFKKVAEMLTEIQRLVIPDKSPKSTNDDEPLKSNDCEILRHLAQTYLSPEEIIKYYVDSELNELEKS